ncbi:MAG: hypothetical protein LUD00_04040 [Prevotellaceae bacterium]|nr:hypothetical protein [Prevotellaceae bacterium]
MRNFKNTDTIEVLGAKFYGVKDFVKYSQCRETKDGVYVRAESKRYPCFDSYDYRNEDCFYRNFVFATSEEEVERKLSILEKISPSGGIYNKLTEELYLMAYWQGDTYHDILLTNG